MSSTPGLTLRDRARSMAAAHRARLQTAPTINDPELVVAAAVQEVPQCGATPLIEALAQRGGRAPTTTANQGRLRIFQSTRRPARVEEVFCTSWGKVRVKGKLGQQHADVSEALLFAGTAPKELVDGRISLLVDPAAVRRIARQESSSTFRAVLDDLMQGLVEIIEPRRLACLGHLIDHIDFRATGADGAFIMARNPLGGERHLWRVDLGKALCRLLEADHLLYRDPAPVAALRHGISQAVARHVLSHKAEPCGGWTLDGLIQMVAGPIGRQSLRDRRRELCGPRGDAEALRHAGVLIDADRVRRVEQKPDRVEQKPGVWSKSPTLAAVSGVSDSRRRRP